MHYFHNKKPQTLNEVRGWLESCLSQQSAIAPKDKNSPNKNSSDKNHPNNVHPNNVQQEGIISSCITVGLSIVMFYLMGMAVISVAEDMLQVTPSHHLASPSAWRF